VKATKILQKLRYAFEQYHKIISLVTSLVNKFLKKLASLIFDIFEQQLYFSVLIIL